jgi:hypothetical protein
MQALCLLNEAFGTWREGIHDDRVLALTIAACVFVGVWASL